LATWFKALNASEEVAPIFPNAQAVRSWTELSGDDISTLANFA
jgi:hypothetical protein